MRLMKKYRVLLFDLDGTLTDPKEGITKCVQYALEYMGIKEDNLDEFEKFIGPPLDNSFREFYGMSDEDAWKAVAKYRERFNKVGKYENFVYDGMKALLTNLRKGSCLIAVATSKPEDMARDILDKFELTEYFDEIVGSDYEGRLHEKYQVILEALKRLDIPKEQFDKVLMIGDRKYDIIGGKLAGVATMGVRYGYAPKGELEENGADYIVDTVEALDKWLERNDTI